MSWSCLGKQREVKQSTAHQNKKGGELAWCKEENLHEHLPPRPVLLQAPLDMCLVDVLFRPGLEDRAL